MYPSPQRDKLELIMYLVWLYGPFSLFWYLLLDTVSCLQPRTLGTHFRIRNFIIWIRQ